MTEFVEKLKVLTSNLTLSCDMCFEDDPLPRFDFDTFNLLKGIDIAMNRLIAKNINNEIAKEIRLCDTEHNYDD